MNTDEITPILRHLLANCRASFLAVVASDKPSPVNSIQVVITCCYVLKTNPTGQAESNRVAFFHSRPNPY